MATFEITKDSFEENGIIEILVKSPSIPSEGYPVAVRADGADRARLLEICAITAAEVEVNLSR